MGNSGNKQHNRGDISYPRPANQDFRELVGNKSDNEDTFSHSSKSTYSARKLREEALLIADKFKAYNAQGGDTDPYARNELGNMAAEEHQALMSHLSLPQGENVLSNGDTVDCPLSHDIQDYYLSTQYAVAKNKQAITKPRNSADLMRQSQICDMKDELALSDKDSVQSSSSSDIGNSSIFFNLKERAQQAQPQGQNSDNECLKASSSLKFNEVTMPSNKDRFAAQKGNNKQSDPQLDRATKSDPPKRKFYASKETGHADSARKFSCSQPMVDQDEFGLKFLHGSAIPPLGWSHGSRGRPALIYTAYIGSLNMACLANKDPPAHAKHLSKNLHWNTQHLQKEGSLLQYKANLAAESDATAHPIYTRWNAYTSKHARNLAGLERKMHCSIQIPPEVFYYRGVHVHPVIISGPSRTAILRCKNALPAKLSQNLITAREYSEESHQYKGRSNTTATTTNQ